MAWVRLDDGFPNHPKVLEAGERAAWLFVLGLCHCNHNRIEGHMTDAVVARLSSLPGTPKLAARLVEVGLWERTKNGYAIHDYRDYQVTEAQRADARARMRKHRAKRPDVTPNESVTEGVTDSVTQDVTLTRAQDARRERGKYEPEASSQGEARVDARNETASLVAEVVGILSQSDRLYVDVVGVENAIAAWPERDHVRAARTVVTWATDPAFRSTNGARLLLDALSKQPPADKKTGLEERRERGVAAIERLMKAS